MLLTASRTSPRARILQCSASASSALSPSVALLQSRCARQSRELCWSVHSGPERGRRHRGHRYQYLESLSRNLSWDKDANKTIKKAMDAITRASQIGHGKKYVNVDEIKSWSDEISGLRPGKNIEDVERSAMDHLIRGDKPLSFDHDMWKYPLTSIRQYLESQSDTAAATESDIDPITNRRRVKASPKQSEPTPLYNDLDGYKASDFSEPVQATKPTQKYDDLHRYGPVPDNHSAIRPVQATEFSDLDKYKPILDSTPPAPKQSGPRYDDLDKYEAVRWNEPDGLRKATPEEASKNYKDLSSYSTAKFDDPFTQRKLTSEEQSKFYDDLDQYKPSQWNEPDGLRKPTKEELSKNYDDLHKYGPVHWNEPDGLRKQTPEELSKNYKDLNEYGPVVWSEPDGLRRLTPEEESKNYDDLAAYDSPFVAKISTLEAHAAAQMDATPKAEPIPAKVDAPAEDLTNKYDDLHKYGPVHWNEPDGLRKLTPEELSKNYDDLDQYGAVQWNEPDGLRKLTPEEKSKQYADVPLYAPRDLPGPEVNAKRIHPEEASKNYKDLPAYHDYANADPETRRIHPEEATKQYEDLDKYAAFEDSGREQGRIHPEQASKEYKDLDKYSTAGFEEAKVTKHIHPEELTKEYDDLDKYKPTSFDSFDSQYPVHPEEATKAYKDLDRYSAIRHNEPDGKPASKLDKIAQGLLEYDSKAGSQVTRNGPSVTHPLYNRHNGDDPSSINSEVEPLTAQDIRAATLRRARERSQDDEMEQFDGASQLSGNYVRDFPEEFSTSWSTDNSITKSALFPKDKVQALEAAEADSDSVGFSSMDESFPRDEHRIQTALDRHIEKNIGDPYSREPQGLETCFAEECGMETLPVIEKHYASKTLVDEGSTGESSAGETPALFKILAYDPASQTMSIAEASTTIHDAGPHATLADVLLRLSNPSKFLPHFEGLQAEGYEVMSGNGNVLIFHKVRPESTHAGAAKSAFTRVGTTRVNPIDMMGKPIMGNFASPTGFVNYETLSESMDKPAPPFRPTMYSSEDGRVSQSQAPSGRKKRRLGRKLILGTAGLAGSAYAVLMTAEYLSTRDARKEPLEKAKRP